MLQHVKRVVDILSTQPKPCTTRAGAHDEILWAILSEEAASLDRSIKIILDSYLLGLGNDEYWVPVFEALVVAQYDQAEVVIDKLVTELHR